MNSSNLEKAYTLIEALPYIQKYRDKVIVVKYGGNAMKNASLKEMVIKDIILMSCVGIKVVLVHGGGPEIDKLLKKIGKTSEFINGLRYTDEETAEVVEMVLAGKINKELVSLIGNNGGKAIGLSGMDGSMLKVKKIQGEVDLGYVGEVEEVNTDVIENLLEKRYISVVGTVTTGTDGKIYNVNADTAAAKIAVALKAEKIILLTDVPGLLTDLEDETTLISKVGVNEIEGLIEKEIIGGGMIPKITCCVDAVKDGVNKAHIIDGRVPHSLLLELFSKGGIGTMIEG